MAAKETLTDAGTTKPRARRAPSKRAAAQDKEPARTKKPTPAKAAVNATMPVFTHEMIAERAYHISLSEVRGTDVENWHRAEAELRQRG